MDTNPTVTPEQVKVDFDAGTLMVQLEYRSSKCENISWRDKNPPHATLKGVAVTHSCENNTEAIIISERVPDDFDVKTFAPPFKRGQKVICYFDDVSKNKGVMTLRGKLKAIEANGKPVDTKPPGK